MKDDPELLRKRLKEAGFSESLINAAWPSWWSDDANSSDSAKAELRFTVARRLGISPQSLFHDDVKFVWKDEARFKHLSNETDDEKSILTSFGISVGRILTSSAESRRGLNHIEALQLRASILENRQFVDLQALLATCWALGIPVIHLRVFPLASKRMYAMAVRVGDRHAVLLGRDANYPAPIAFALAHEIGHIMLGHVAASSAIVDIGDPLTAPHDDAEEQEADEYALELLLGSSQPQIEANLERFNAPQLAAAVLQQGPQSRIEPGTLALCVAYHRGIWAVASSAMKFIYAEHKPVWQQVNAIAAAQLDFTTRDDDSTDYLERIMGIGDE